MSEMRGSHDAGVRNNSDSKGDMNDMKVAVSALDNTLDAEVDSRFGRCKYFLIIDTETMQFEEIVNEQQQAMGGAGIQAAQILVNKGVESVITGSIGPNAFRVLSTAGLKIFTGATGPVKDTIIQFNNGELEEIRQATVQAHHGSKQESRERSGGADQ